MEKDAYPEDWERIAFEVKEKADWCCTRCGHPHSPETGYSLTVHHLDGIKANVSETNLAALCQRCHLRFQSFLRGVAINQLSFLKDTNIEVVNVG